MTCNTFRFKAFCLAILSLLLIIGCSQPTPSADAPSQANGSEAPAEPISLRFAAGSQSGSWYPLAVNITEMMKKNMGNLEQVSIEQGGGVSNVMSVNQEQTDIGFSHGMSIIDGVNGLPPFPQKNENLKYVLSLDPYYMQIAVFKDSGIESVEDLRGKKINVGPKSATTEVAARMVLEAYGMSFEDMGSVQHLSHADSVEQMKDGRFDALFWVMGAPFAVMTDLTQSKDIKFLSIPEDKIEQLAAKNPALLKGTLKAGTYKGLDQDVTTFKTPLAVIANQNTSEELVYEAAKSIYNGLSELVLVNPSLKEITPEDLSVDIGLPMHPGAEKFFQELAEAK